MPPDQINIQLYTLRDQLAIDLEGTLEPLSAIGYTRVEHAGFVGRTVEEFKAALDAAGLRSTSGHVLIPQPFGPAAWSASLADANTLGSRYIVHPFFGIDFATGEVTRTAAPWRAFALPIEPDRPHGQKPGLARLPQPGGSSADRQPADRHNVLARGHRPGPGPAGPGSVLGHPGARDPVDLIEQNKGRVTSTTSRT